jgi:hypothetical protein
MSIIAKTFTDISWALCAVGGIIQFVSMLNIIAFLGTDLDYMVARFSFELIVGTGMCLVGGVFRIIGIYIEHRNLINAMEQEHIPLINVQQ